MVAIFCAKNDKIPSTKNNRTRHASKTGVGKCSPERVFALPKINVIVPLPKINVS